MVFHMMQLNIILINFYFTEDNVPFIQGKLNTNPPQSPVNKSRLVKPSSSTIRKQVPGDRGQHSKARNAANGVVQIDAGE